MERRSRSTLIILFYFFFVPQLYHFWVRFFAYVTVF